MDQACALNFNTHQLQCINAVRLYCQVTFISEISNIEGTHIIPQVYNQAPIQDYQPKPLSLHQPKPNRKSFSMWIQLLNTLTNNTRRLHQRLGPWNSTHSQRGHWSAYHDSTTNRIIRKTQYGWT